MQFVYPAFLFALLAVLIPVLIHLFHFRRFRKIYFPNVTFLQQLSDESKKQSRLKHLLVLLSRILAISFLVMAFAQPFIPAGDAHISPEGNTVGVYIDNSFSMEALAGTGRLLDQAREHARDIALLYQPGDRFILLTNDFEGRHQRFMSRDEFIALLGEVHESPAVRSIAEVIQRKNELMSENYHAVKSSYLISDFQKSTADIESIEADTTISTFFIPLYAQQAGNLFIDTLWFESPVKILGQPVMMKVAMRNDNDHHVDNQALRLYIDGVQRAVASWDAPGRGVAEVELTWTINAPGIRQGWVEIVDYPVTFDDQMHFSYRTTTEIPVLSIHQQQPSPFLRALFGRDTTFTYSEMPASAIDFSSFGQYNLIILNNLNTISAGLSRELQQFAAQGGSVVVFPGQDADLGSYQDFLATLNIDAYTQADDVSTRVTALNELHEVFSGVFETLPDNIDLPVVNRYYPIRRDARSRGQYLLQLQNGNNFFSAYTAESGNVFLSSVPLDDSWSNLPRHPVFVPLMANIAMQSHSYFPLYSILGRNEPVNIRAGSSARDEVYYLRGDDLEVIPEQRHAGNTTRLFFHDQVHQAGSYVLNRGEEQVRGISFNYDRRESLLESWPVSDLREILLNQGLQHISVIPTPEAGFEQALREFRLGWQLWRHFIVLALLFLLVEVALLRFWK